MSDSPRMQLPDEVLDLVMFQLFRVGLDLYGAIGLIEHDQSGHARQRIRSAVDRLDDVLVEVRDAAVRRSLPDPVLVDAPLDELSGALTAVVRACVGALAVDAAGVVVATGDGKPALAAASTDSLVLRRLFATYLDRPDSNAWHGVQALSTDLRNGDSPLSVQAVVAGVRTVHVMPMHVREHIVGTLVMFSSAPGALPAADARTARGLADLAAMALYVGRVAGPDESPAVSRPERARPMP